MEYVTQHESKLLKRQIEEIQNKIDHYNQNCKDYFIPCAICGNQSTTYTKSMIGSFKWLICNNHGEVASYIGSGKMGVMVNGVETPMPFLDAQQKALKEFSNINQ